MPRPPLVTVSRLTAVAIAACASTAILAAGLAGLSVAAGDQGHYDSAAALNQATPTIGPPPPQPTPGLCEVTASLAVPAADDVRVGDLVTAVAQVRTVSCPDLPRNAAHFVFVVETSATMSDSLEQVRDLLQRTAIVAQERVARSAQFAVVTYGGTAEIACGFTDEHEALGQCIEASVGPEQAGLPEGLHLASTLLRDHRKEAADASLLEMVFFVTSDPPAADCDRVAAARAPLLTMGALSVGVCAGDDCGSGCADQAATSVRHFFHIASFRPEALLRNRHEAQIFLKRLTMTYTLGQGWMTTPDWADPPAQVLPGALRWSTSHVSKGGFTGTVGIRPVTTGSLSVGSLAVTVVDNMDRTATLPITEGPSVMVLPKEPVFLPRAINRAVGHDAVEPFVAPVSNSG